MKNEDQNENSFITHLYFFLSLLYARYLSMQNDENKETIDYMEKYVIDEKVLAHDSMIQLQIQVWQLQDSINNILKNNEARADTNF